MNHLASTKARAVAVFSTRYLQYSQTFIYEQLINHRRYAPEVFCWRKENLDRFAFDPVHSANLAYGLTAYSPAFMRRFTEQRFDVVHAHFAPGAVYALPYAQRFQLPFVVTFHGYDVPLHWNRRRFHPEYWPFLFKNRQVLERMTLGLCASSELKKLLVDHGVPESKLRVCRLGIDLDKFQPRSNYDSPITTVTFVGRLVEKKGVEYAIRAFSAHANPSARMVVIGDGPLRRPLEKLVKELGSEAYVQFCGAVPASQVAKQLSQTDVLLAPSVIAPDGDRESGLIVAKEAGACGVPVIGTWHGGIPEIIDDGVTGFLVPERDTRALAEKLKILLDDPERRARMGRAARQKMEREYSIHDRMAELEERYDEAIQLYRGA